VPWSGLFKRTTKNKGKVRVGGGTTSSYNLEGKGEGGVVGLGIHKGYYIESAILVGKIRGKSRGKKSGGGGGSLGKKGVVDSVERWRTEIEKEKGGVGKVKR